MDKIKQQREKMNKALETMENLNKEYKGEDFPEGVQEKFNEAKKNYEKSSNILAREQMLEEKRKDDALRNHNDGSNKKPKNFNFIDAVKYAVNPRQLDNYKQGFYAELNREAENEASAAGVTLQGGNGLVLPTNVLGGGIRNDLTISTEGGDLTYDERGAFIEDLNERLILRQLGADFMTGLVGDVKFSKETNSPTFTWEGETDSNSESTPTFGNVTLSPKRGGTFVDISNQALKQTSPSVEGRIRGQLLSAAQRGIESAAISGSGASPTGIHSAATKISGSTGNGSGSLAYNDVIDLEGEVASKDANVGSLAYLASAKGRSAAKKTKKDSGSGIYVWEDSEVNGYNASATNLVADGSTFSPFYFGNFNDVLIGMWGGIELLPDPYTQATNGITRLVMNTYVDVGIAHDESFAFYEVDIT
ncbi:phage major capsid protein [Aliifodinibius sp. S!AR15-10]|uniref:phage major capsid protein n=1 Tax=Aliifodinibius sp. S!AR15-10 TaxID=2950437 RepID=UPI002863211A|nr:phage major capsid protein [Aliifodinibius sp. S!AR15-10]MDR8390990.1 phage major capsid protein [Aliifodinibius sp. S!AR15-10]